MKYQVKTTAHLIVQLARAKQTAVVETLEAHAPKIVLFRIVGERAEVLGDHRTHLQMRMDTAVE